MKRRTKVILGVGLLVVTGVIGAMGVTSASRKAVAVRIEPVTRRDLVATVEANGWIRPHRKVDVRADIMGRIVELRVKEGDSVKKGQILLRIDPTEYEAAVARARAAVSEAMAREAQARANLLQAERALERSRAMAAQDSALVSPQALEEAETQVRIQRALAEAAMHGVAQARAALNEAQDRLAKTVIRAPMDGIVTRLEVEEGETAIIGTMNNPGSLLLTISDLSVMEAVVRVDETDVPALELGDSAVVRIDAFPRKTFVGRVTEIGHSAVNPQESNPTSQGAQAVDFKVVITLQDPPRTLRPDLSATAEIVTDTRSGALAIPILALTVRERRGLQPVPQESREGQQAAAAAAEEGDEEGVFVVRAGKAHFVPVEVGIVGKEHFEVLRGLSEGDSVVAGPYEAIRTLTDGKPVRTLGPAGAGAPASQGGGSR
jgi:HlyD family secretion protein